MDINTQYCYNLSHSYSMHNTHITYSDNRHGLQRAGQDGCTGINLSFIYNNHNGMQVTGVQT